MSRSMPFPFNIHGGNLPFPIPSDPIISFIITIIISQQMHSIKEIFFLPLAPGNLAHFASFHYRGKSNQM
jgi:hypothetical protein